MIKKRKTHLVAAGAVASMVMIAGCGGGGSSPTAATAFFNAGLTRVVNPSDHRGGTLTFDLAGTPDSTDPGNMYFAYMLNFVRLYGQSLMTYESCPGKCGLQLVPGLATAPGTVGDHGLTWTYHIRPGVKFSTGQTVTSADVKYAVERTYARSVLPNGPTYFQVLLADSTYPGPYTDRAKNLMGLKSVTTPNPTTIVFHLKHPFSDFNYVVAFPQTVPVPPSADTGANYQLKVVSTGPYRFQSYSLNNRLTLVPNKYWNPAEDPNAKQLVNKIIVNMNVNASDIDNRQLAGDVDVNMLGTGVQAATRARILASPALKKYADDGYSGFLYFAYLNTKVIPNVHCRKAIEYAADKTTLQDAYGGPVAGGSIASTVLTPEVLGYKQFDLYDTLSKPTGDVAATKQQLKLCGKPNGFSTDLAYRSDQPAEASAAQALQAALSGAGIKTTLRGYPTSSYYGDFAGVPSYVQSHDLGIAMGAWEPDWPDGYGMLDEISNGNAIVPSGNTNTEELNDPLVNKLFAKAAGLSNATQRAAIWGQIDHQIMSDAAILPMVYAKALQYRNPNLTNVYTQSFYGMYNYAVLGLKS